MHYTGRRQRTSTTALTGTLTRATTLSGSNEGGGGAGAGSTSEQHREARRLLGNGKGFAVVVSPASASLPPFGTVTVEVMVVGDTWGKYVSNFVLTCTFVAPFFTFFCLLCFVSLSLVNDFTT